MSLHIIFYIWGVQRQRGILVTFTGFELSTDREMPKPPLRVCIGCKQICPTPHTRYKSLTFLQCLTLTSSVSWAFISKTILWLGCPSVSGRLISVRSFNMDSFIQILEWRAISFIGTFTLYRFIFENFKFIKCRHFTLHNWLICMCVFLRGDVVVTVEICVCWSVELCCISLQGPGVRDFRTTKEIVAANRGPVWVVAAYRGPVWFTKT